MIEVDYGLDDGITKAWTGALLDDDGRVASPWGPVTPIARDRSTLTLSVSWASVRLGQHVVLRADRDPDPRGSCRSRIRSHERTRSGAREAAGHRRAGVRWRQPEAPRGP